MGLVNSDVHYFLEQHEQEIINCCKKAMSNKEILELLKTKYGREVSLSTFKEFKAGLKSNSVALSCCPWMLIS